MKIAINGLGKMGTLIKESAINRGHSVITIDPHNSQADYQKLSDAPLEECQSCIEFSHPDAVINVIETVLERGVPLVVGTTGWYNSLPEIKKLVASSNSSFLYASNFSIGVHLFTTIARQAAKLIDGFSQYDTAGFEAHHNQKADSPSGTARTIAEAVLDSLSRKEKLVFGSPDRRIESNELQFSSMRCGSIPGIHEVHFDSEVDSIVLRHEARNRNGFADGAVQAAEWLDGKPGFFTIDDLIADALK